MLQVASALLILGFCDHRPCDSGAVDDAALLIAEAAGTGPYDVTPETVRTLLPAIWKVESRFSLHPRSRGTGHGAVQVVPRSKLYNTRCGHWTTSPGSVQRWHLPTHLSDAVRLLRCKAYRCKRNDLRCLSRVYNASQNARSYSSRVMKHIKRTQ